MRREWKYFASLGLIFLALAAIGADNFVRGYQFSGETGAKTGDDLEDLVTQAEFAAGSGALDQTTIEDDGNGKARIKAGGITSVHISDNARDSVGVQLLDVPVALCETANRTSWVSYSISTNDVPAWADGIIIQYEISASSGDYFRFWTRPDASATITNMITAPISNDMGLRGQLFAKLSSSNTVEVYIYSVLSESISSASGTIVGYF